MNDDIKFTTYNQWEKYIQSKYKSLNKSELKEFSHFLNLKIRNIKPGYEYYKIIIPVMITLMVDELFSTLMNISQIKMDTFLSFVIELEFIVITMILSLSVIIKITKPIWDVTDKINFYSDYKKIIDDMIEKMDKDVNV